MQIANSLLRKRRPTSETPGEVIHTDLEGPFHPDVTGNKYFQVFVHEANRDKRIQGLKIRCAAADATANYNDEMAWKGATIKRINGDGAGELERSVKFQRMLADRGIKCRSSPPRTPQSHGVAERAIHQLVRIARRQLVKAGRYWFLAVADAAFKTAGMPRKPRKTLGGRLHASGLEGISSTAIVSVRGERNASCIKTNLSKTLGSSRA